MKKTVSVITPTYNRAYTLSQAYESLKRQTCKDFYWLVVDDGSIDNTQEVIENFKKDNIVEIEYIKQENGGKHRALNNAIQHADSKLIVSLDSDDFLVDDAIEKVLDLYNGVKSFDGICGFSFLKLYKNMEVIGDKFPKDYYISNHIECRFNNLISGDKAEVYLTEVLKKFPFPEFDGEKFLTEAIVWNRIGREYNTIYVNEPLIVCEYLADGISSKEALLSARNPQGMALYYNECSDEAFSEKLRLRNRIRYVAYSLAKGLDIEKIKEEAKFKLDDETLKKGIEEYKKIEKILEENK